MTVTGYSGKYDGSTHVASLTSVFGVDGKTTLPGTLCPHRYQFSQRR